MSRRLMRRAPIRQFMASAGYDPRAAFDLWDLMAAVEADAAAHGSPVSVADQFSLLQTHPTSHVRQEVRPQECGNSILTR